MPGLRFRSTLIACAVAGALLLFAPEAALAQGRVYSASEVQTPASVKNKSAAAHEVERSYPKAAQRLGGKVQLQFIVRADGVVDPASIKVVVASATVLGEAASKAIKQIEFNPATVGGQAVASVVSFPVTYAAR